MGVPQDKISQPRFSHVFSYRQLSENRLRGEELERSIQVKWIHITAIGFKSPVSFGNDGWSKDLKMFDSCTRLTHAKGLFTTISVFFFGNGYY